MYGPTMERKKIIKNRKLNINFDWRKKGVHKILFSCNLQYLKSKRVLIKLITSCFSFEFGGKCRFRTVVAEQLVRYQIWWHQIPLLYIRSRSSLIRSLLIILCDYLLFVSVVSLAKYKFWNFFLVRGVQDQEEPNLIYDFSLAPQVRRRVCGGFRGRWLAERGVLSRCIFRFLCSYQLKLLGSIGYLSLIWYQSQSKVTCLNLGEGIVFSPLYPKSVWANCKWHPSKGGVK